MDGCLLLEGERLIRDAFSCGVELEVVLVAEDRMDVAGALASEGAEVRLVEPGLLQQVSTLNTSPGSLALGVTPALKSVAEWNDVRAKTLHAEVVGSKLLVGIKD